MGDRQIFRSFIEGGGSIEKNKKIKKTSSSDSSKQEHYTQILLESINYYLDLIIEQNFKIQKIFDKTMSSSDKRAKETVISR